MATVLAGIQAQLPGLNEARKQDYLLRFSDFADTITTGRPNGSPPPVPPKALVIGFFTDPTNGLARWAYATEGTEPVCAMPPVPAASGAPKYTRLHIGKRVFRAFFGVGPDDNTPIDATVSGTSEDGVGGLFLRVGSPGGDHTGWFELVG